MGAVPEAPPDLTLITLLAVMVNAAVGKFGIVLKIAVLLTKLTVKEFVMVGKYGIIVDYAMATILPAWAAPIL